jgi:hypothetical protein
VEIAQEHFGPLRLFSQLELATYPFLPRAISSGSKMALVPTVLLRSASRKITVPIFSALMTQLVSNRRWIVLVHTASWF